MNKATFDAFGIRLFGTAGSPTFLSTVIFYLAYGLCTYCAILRGVLVGIGLALFTHLSVPWAILGATCIAAAAILTAIEREAKNEGAV